VLPWLFPFDALLTSSTRFAIIQLNLAGPLLAVTRTVTGEVLYSAQTRSSLLTRPLQIQRQATARLREHFSQPVDTAPPRQPRLAAPVSTRRDGDQEEFEMNAMEDKVL
jgi:hypothetical protein